MTLIDRNRTFAETRFRKDLTMRPSTIVIGCFDPRVDPAVVLGAEQGEFGLLRNVGGRVTPQTIEELLMLRQVALAASGDVSAGGEIVVLQHTQCGITRIKDRPDLLAPYFRIEAKDLPEVSVGAPRAAVAHDVAVLRAESRLPGVTVTGLVYDVTTGLVEIIPQ